MQTLQWHGPGDVRLLPAEQPTLMDATDAVIRVTASAICGTDLHPYRGEIPDFPVGTVTGHEFTGVVESVGAHVATLAPGDRVVASDLIACGRCVNCRRGWHYQCREVNLFGYGTVVGAVPVAGGHAEYVRVPFADVVLRPIPDDVTDEQALFIGDILATGFACATGAEIKPGDTVAVIGCGPVGLMAAACARLLGAGRVLAIDPRAARRAVAAGQGAVPLNVDGDLSAAVAELTDGRGCDAVLEAVGTQAALDTALDVVGARGTVCVVGVHATEDTRFSGRAAFAKEVTVRFAVGDPITSGDQLMRIVRQGLLDPTFVVSHRFPLSDGVKAYELFDRGEAVKVVLR